MKVRKIIGLVLVFIMVFGFLPLTSSAERNNSNSQRPKHHNSSENMRSYHKSIQSRNDISRNRKGDEYVKNQILVTTVDGVSFEMVEELAINSNVAIVGYIELTDDYQFETTQTISEEQLNDLINELNQNPLIEYVSLNIAFKPEYESTYFPNDDLIQTNLDVWNLQAINASAAWDYYRTNATTSVNLGI